MNIYSIIPYVALLLGVVSVIWLITLEIRLKRFFRGKRGSDLEDTIIALGNTGLDLSRKLGIAQNQLADLNNRVKKSVNGVELIRFNPFKDAGSNQSFAVALLNEEGDGVVFSSLYSRERVSVFAKALKDGVSEQELTQEEKTVVAKARGVIQK